MAANWKIIVTTTLLVLGVLCAREGLRSLPKDELAGLASTIAQARMSEITHGSGRPGTISVIAEGTRITITRTGALDYRARNVVTRDTPFTMGPQDINRLIATTCHSRYGMIFTRMGGSVRYRYIGADGQAVSAITLNSTLCLGHWLSRETGRALKERAAYVLALSLVLAEKRAKVGDALRGGISWRCSDAVNSQPRKGYATCQRLPSLNCPIHQDLAPTHSPTSCAMERAS